MSLDRYLVWRTMLPCLHFPLFDEPQSCHVYSNRKDHSACHTAAGNLPHRLLQCPATCVCWISFRWCRMRCRLRTEEASAPSWTVLFEPMLPLVHGVPSCLCADAAVQNILIPCSLVVEWPHEYSQIMDNPPPPPPKSLLETEFSWEQLLSLQHLPFSAYLFTLPLSLSSSLLFVSPLHSLSIVLHCSLVGALVLRRKFRTGRQYFYVHLNCIVAWLCLSRRSCFGLKCLAQG